MKETCDVTPLDQKYVIKLYNEENRRIQFCRMDDFIEIGDNCEEADGFSSNGIYRWKK